MRFRRAIERLALAGPAFVMMQSVAQAGKLRCEPRLVFRGDSFVVDLPAHHEGYDLAILDDKQFLISFKPGPLDKIRPVIPSELFGKMKRVKISAKDAQGSPSDPWRSDRPRALGPPERIFTQSGSYEVVVGPALGAEDADFDACSVDYINDSRQGFGGDGGAPR